MSIDELRGIVDHAVEALMIGLREKGCVPLNKEEIEMVEAIILASLAKSGVMRVD
jgi:hypothetical protein